jgi:two-component system chemotaxis sensor kinase CheA
MPRRLQRDGRTLELAWKPVIEEGAMKRILVIAQDISERLEAEKAEQQGKELRDLVGSVLRDKSGFSDGVNDARTLLQVIASESSRSVVRRALHTLKGNAAMFGFHQLAASCHELESEVCEADGDVTAEHVAALRDKFEAALLCIKDVFGEEFLSLIEVRDRDLVWLMKALEERYEHASVLAFVASWRDESIDSVLRRLASQAKRIATNLGKELEVVVDDHGARVPAGELRTFWNSLVHAVRNAVDHGLEAREGRLAAGKPACGRLVLRALAEGRTLTLEIEDDGRGIDFDALGSAAVRRGLPAGTREELVEALFADGVSTKSEVTALSGRGLGMAALREACRDLGGTLDVDSRAGAGTRLTFRIPLSRASTVTFLAGAAA